MKRKMMRQQFAANAAGFVGLLPKVVVCIVLAGACAGPAAAALVVATNDFMQVTEATTITGPTNIYVKNVVSGVDDNSRIQADLSLKSKTFLRFIGDTSSKPKTNYLDFGPASGDGVVTVSTDANSGLYTSCRLSSGEGGAAPISYVQTRIGHAGGSATFDVSGVVSPVGYSGFQAPAFGVWSTISD